MFSLCFVNFGNSKMQNSDGRILSHNSETMIKNYVCADTLILFLWGASTLLCFDFLKLWGGQCPPGPPVPAALNLPPPCKWQLL